MLVLISFSEEKGYDAWNFVCLENFVQLPFQVCIMNKSFALREEIVIEKERNSHERQT